MTENKEEKDPHTNVKENNTQKIPTENLNSPIDSTKVYSAEEMYQVIKAEFLSNRTKSVPLRLNKPEVFSGIRSKTNTFINQVEDYLLLQDPATDKQKIIITSSFLRGTAQDWAQVRRAKGIDLLYFSDWLKEFKDAFTDFNQADGAADKLSRLKQTGSVIQYKTQFDQIAFFTGYNDTALRFAYKRGLKDEIKDLLVTRPKPNNIEELQKYSLEIGERLFQNKIEQRNSRYNSSNYKIRNDNYYNKGNNSNKNYKNNNNYNNNYHNFNNNNNNNNNKSYNIDTNIQESESVPMELDQITRIPHRKLSDEEKSRRRREKLCLYCGIPGCPGNSNLNNCTKKKRTNFNEMNIQNSHKTIVPGTINGIKSNIFIDSGFDGRLLIDNKFVHKLKLKVKPLKKQIEMLLGDTNKSNTPICFETEEFTLRIGNHVERVSGLIHTLQNPITLGHIWLSEVNPIINWRQKTLKFNNSTIPIKDKNNVNKLSFSTNNISLIQNNIKNKSKDNIKEENKIPSDYKEFTDVFTPKQINNLPINRKTDMKIDISDISSLSSKKKIYPLSKQEDNEMKEYIKKALQRKWIRKSNSSIASPCFFVKKSNGQLRLCVDYRQINSITTKKQYPLPIINELLDTLKGSNIFTKLDLPNAFHLLRIHPGDEWKTAFICKYGTYEYLVVPFGLTNAPAYFQDFMQQILNKQNLITCIIYIDDILIFSKNITQHIQDVKEILKILRENYLFVNLEKSKFHLHQVNFLGFTISSSGILMDKNKVSAITEWKPPTSIKEIQCFLGFANFYRRFIKNFSTIVKPITLLLKKDVKFTWSSSQEAAFHQLKESFSSAPILKQFDFAKPAILETDASDFGIGSILSQDNNGVIHPVAFFSRSLSAAEINYDIHDKELLAIIASFKHFRQYLIGSNTTILTDHSSLTYFTKNHNLNRRQFRWLQFLQDFEFTIKFRPGKKGGKPDALSRKAELKEVLKPIKYTFFNNITLVNPENINAKLKSSKPTNLLQAFKGNKLPDSFKMFEGNLYFKNRIVIEDPEIIADIIASRHNSRIAGHLGINKTKSLISRDFYFTNLSQKVKLFIRNCHTCNLAKASRGKQPGKLLPPVIPNRPWEHISIDFITDLPTSNTFTAILVIKDRFSKMIHLFPTTKEINSFNTALIFFNNIFKLYGAPRTIICDRGPQFASKFFKNFFLLLNTKINLTSAYHPQSDGSTEVVNQIIEQYIRIFCNYHQDNWSDLLTLVEFTYNNSSNSVHGNSPFFVLYGFHPHFDEWSFHTLNPAVEKSGKDLTELREECFHNLQSSASKYSKYYNKKRLDVSFKVDDFVYLSTKHLKSSRPSRKLDFKFSGPFKIIQVINPVAYKLLLPQSWRIHNVFHISLLKKCHSKPKFSKPPPEIINNEEEYEVENILDSKILRGKRFFLIKWRGYDSSENTWESESNLANASEILSDFKLEHKLI